MPLTAAHPWSARGAHFVLACALIMMALGAQPRMTRAEVIAPKVEPNTVLVMGDSLAAGYGLDPTEAFPALLQKKADAAGLKVNIVNGGLSGDTSAGGLRRLDWLLKRHLDVLLLELGGNDGLRGIPVEVTRTNLQTIIDRTKSKFPRARVVILGMQMPPNMGAEYAGSFQKVYPDLAKKNNATLVPFLLEGVGGKPEFNLPDQIHPTAAGQKILADNVWKFLRPVLEEVAAAKR